MTQKLIGIAVVVCVLLAGAYVVQNRYGRTDATYQVQAAEEPGRGVVGMVSRDHDPVDIVIAYTKDGYATTSVTVKKGTRIRFLNESDEPTWPASGIHPTHTLYPEKQDSDCLGSSFDSCKTLARGEYFDYTFNYVGRWPFHDHMHGYHSGEIIVE
jgi:hypothetical protein